MGFVEAAFLRSQQVWKNVSDEILHHQFGMVEACWNPINNGRIMGKTINWSKDPIEAPEATTIPNPQSAHFSGTSRGTNGCYQQQRDLMFFRYTWSEPENLLTDSNKEIYIRYIRYIIIYYIYIYYILYYTYYIIYILYYINILYIYIIFPREKRQSLRWDSLWLSLLSFIPSDYSLIFYILSIIW